MASITLSLTSCAASMASCPLAPTSDTTPSTFAFARLQATLPLAAKISAICVASRVTSSRSACRSAWISSLAAEAALPLSRAASLTSRAVSRTVSLIVLEGLDIYVLHSDLRNIRRAANGAQGKKFRLGAGLSVRQLTLVRGKKMRHRDQDHDGQGHGEERPHRTPQPRPKRECQQDRERIEREPMPQNGRSDELAFDRRHTDECRRRHERIGKRGKTYEANAEQDQRRASRADIGNVIER